MDFITDMGPGNLLDGIQGGVESFIFGQIKSILPIFLLICIPVLGWAIWNCFFGYRFKKIIVLIHGILSGMGTGAVLGLIVAASSYKKSLEKAGIFGGIPTFPFWIVALFVILGAVVFGLICWYVFAVGAFFLSWGVGCNIVVSLLTIIGCNAVAAFVIGLVLGLVAAVLVIIYEKPVFIATTALDGASAIASIFAITMAVLLENLTAYNVIYILLLLCVGAGGMYVQFSYEKKHGVQPVYTPSPMPQGYTPSPAPVASSGRVCQLVGMEGKYKGFEFDVDSDIAFGRDAAQCNIMYPRETQGVSRVQCQVVLNPERTKAFIVDNHSSYGTKVNGETLQQGKMRALSNGDIIHFGENEMFRVQY